MIRLIVFLFGIASLQLQIHIGYGCVVLQLTSPQLSNAHSSNVCGCITLMADGFD